MQVARAGARESEPTSKLRSGSQRVRGKTLRKVLRMMTGASGQRKAMGRGGEGGAQQPREVSKVAGREADECEGERVGGAVV